MTLISAVLLGLLACVFLYISWKRRTELFAGLGWGALLATLPLWTLAMGAEYGSVFALSLPALYVWLFIAREQKWQANTPIKFKTRQKLTIRWRNVLSGLGKILYLLPLLMLVSALLTLTFVRLLPAIEVNQIAVGIIALPVVWGALACWFFTAKNPRVPLIFNTLTTIFCGLYLFS